MRERPIIFSGEMVRAILDGRKTQTRRVIKPQPSEFAWIEEAQGGEWQLGRDVPTYGAGMTLGADQEYEPIKCPYGQPGDRLWVRETFCHKWDQEGPVFNEDGDYDQSCLWYRATTPDVIKLDEDCEEVYLKDGSPASPWLPSIHMPRWASRILLEITDVRVERVQEITESDSWAEGIEEWLKNDDNLPRWSDGTLNKYNSAAQAFEALWDSINAKRGFGWDVNPWVWVVEFKET